MKQDSRSLQNLLVVVDGFSMGGAESQLLAFLQAARPRLGRLVVFSCGAAGPLRRDFDSVSDRLESHPKRFAFDAGLIARLNQVCAEEKPDVVLSVLFYADVLTGFLAGKVPKVSWQHVLPSRDAKNNRWYHRWTYRRTVSRMDRFICCADCVRLDLQTVYGVPLEKSSVVRNGIDLSRYRYHEPREWTQPRLRLANVGRFSPEKGQDMLVDCLGGFLQAEPGIEVTFYGEGPTRPSLEARVRNLGLQQQVRFGGLHEHLEEVYPRIDALVQTSHYEANPVAILEAMACGTPVIATDVAGTREACADLAQLVPVGEPAALGRAILALRDRGVEKGRLRAARRHVESHYDAERVYEEMLERLLACAGTPLAAE